MVEIEGSSKSAPGVRDHGRRGPGDPYPHRARATHRRMIVEMLFAERNHVCAVCVSNGHCELQTLAQEIGITTCSFPYLQSRGSSRRLAPVQSTITTAACCAALRAGVRRDRRRPHLGRHRAAASKRASSPTWARPGASRRPAPRCGKCVHVCPTGALVEKGHSVAEMHKQRQFLPYLTIMRRCADERQDQAPGHGLARRLLRLPHVLLDMDERLLEVAEWPTWSTARWSTPRSFPRTSTSPWSREA